MGSAQQETEKSSSWSEDEADRKLNKIKKYIVIIIIMTVFYKGAKLYDSTFVIFYSIIKMLITHFPNNNCIHCHCTNCVMLLVLIL